MLEQADTTSYDVPYAPFRRPWWSRTWVWVVVTCGVAITTGAVVLGSSASAAGGCGGG
ncbi:hypothetical protein [Nocardioides baekrokdamisoli]|uniref:hypothetical protein n=1 Tax=Nocardioides baekrokdamisoli TaxID=1804624 RepID=UPI0013DDE596|nr:hypothetical protein [Nocardioides baekrokdamisoli]